MCGLPRGQAHWGSNDVAQGTPIAHPQGGSTAPKSNSLHRSDDISARPTPRPNRRICNQPCQEELDDTTPNRQGSPRRMRPCGVHPLGVFARNNAHNSVCSHTPDPNHIAQEPDVQMYMSNRKARSCEHMDFVMFLLDVVATSLRISAILQLMVYELPCLTIVVSESGLGTNIIACARDQASFMDDCGSNSQVRSS